MFRDAQLLRNEQGPTRVLIEADVIGGTSSRAYYVSAGPGDLSEVIHVGEAAPGGGNFTLNIPSLNQTQPVQHADDAGSTALVADTTTPTTGVFWAIVGTGRFRLAALGSPAPSTGGTFSSFGSPALLSTATGTVVFFGNVAGGSSASGLFRQL